MALRVGVVQLEYRPYFILGTRNCFGEPMLRDKKETALWQAMEGQDALGGPDGHPALAQAPLHRLARVVANEAREQGFPRRAAAVFKKDRFGKV